MAAFLLGVAAAPEAGAPQSAQGGAQLFQGGAQGSGATDGRRMVLLFEANSLSLVEARAAIAAAAEWSEGRPDGALTSIAVNGATLNVLSDFSADRAQAGAVLRSEAFLNSIVAGDTASQVAPLGEQRLRGIASLCSTLAPIEQRKAIIYFSSGLRASDSTNQASLREMTNTCNRANVTINPIDARGLMAAVAGRP
jgi:hypothetical protein